MLESNIIFKPLFEISWKEGASLYDVIYIGIVFSLKKVSTKDCGLKLAPIAVVMPVAVWPFFEALARHLNGKRDRSQSEPNCFASKKKYELYLKRLSFKLFDEAFALILLQKIYP